ncbi:hypothetical protein Ccrd_015676 [Cynara cardunculus var. scolymus]|uniref:Uncharacterized protein n=1 Tax=Cynara cardunculus var. scolymus TaxID=59895 RepID=A0A124SGD2_CYNCS|nr:hypothetical protein Ccrd_015676 [Cynara cardunculus var. scolymus]
MCYPASITLNHEFDIRIRRLPAAAALNHHQHVVVDGHGHGGAAQVKKQCLCSPTVHPGSFRCRHHHSKYVWVGVGPNPRPTQ